MCREMKAIGRNLWKLMIIPVMLVMFSCKQGSYTADNKKRAKHLASLKAKYEEPGQARVKTGNLEDGF